MKEGPGRTEEIHRQRNPDTHRVPGERDVHAFARPDTRYQMLTSREEPGRRHASVYTRKTLSLATEHGHVCSASLSTGLTPRWYDGFFLPVERVRRSLPHPLVSNCTHERCSRHVRACDVRTYS